MGKDQDNDGDDDNNHFDNNGDNDGNGSNKTYDNDKDHSNTVCKKNSKFELFNFLKVQSPTIIMQITVQFILKILPCRPSTTLSQDD